MILPPNTSCQTTFLLPHPRICVCVRACVRALPQILYVDFDASAVEAALGELGFHGANEKRAVYREGLNDTSILVDFFSSNGV